ncbi:MAG: hypothetical protein V4632_16860 [Pseudomonadota bacterium]
MTRSITTLIAAIVLTILTGCATTRLTVDDGRKLDARLLSEMETYGAAAAALRPAIVRAAGIHDTNCNIQYELPFVAMTTYGVENEDVKIAWVRALGVNENLMVIGADLSSGLKTGDVVTEVAGYKSHNTLKLVSQLMDARDRGEPFSLKLASGRKVMISPIRLCRGYSVIASPFQAGLQNYHWAESVHPLEIFHQPLTPDEAEWIVLWTQGLSEQAGARMKTYAVMVGGIKWITMIALGVSTSGASASARSAAAAAGTSSAGQVAAVQLAGQAASLMTRAAANRASLSGINGIAAGQFDEADKWAFNKMITLGMDPRAGMSLHEKLIMQGAAANAFLLDEKRLAGMERLAAELPDEAETSTDLAGPQQPD